jgi:hypothetical protein
MFHATHTSNKEVTVRTHILRIMTAAALPILAPIALAAQATTESAGLPIPFLPNPVVTASTVPANGDQNPYGVAFVPRGLAAGGSLAAGDVLVSNFNNAQNEQGTGTTIVDVPANGGAPTVFFQGQAGLGLTTALEVLQEGVVIVGNMPTSDGTCATAQAGSLLVLDTKGNLVTTLTDPSINGPWDMTVVDRGRGIVEAFVSNALSGTVVRLDLKVSGGTVSLSKSTQVASGYLHRCDPAALVVGPTGLVYDSSDDLLYVASTEDNKVYALAHALTTTGDAGTGRVIYQDNTHLHGPLAMIEAPNGDLLVSNSDVINVDPNQPSEIVEFTKGGRFVKQLSVDPMEGGSFGMGVQVINRTARFAAVDDVTGTVTIWSLPPL